MAPLSTQDPSAQSKTWTFNNCQCFIVKLMGTAFIEIKGSKRLPRELESSLRAISSHASTLLSGNGDYSVTV